MEILASAKYAKGITNKTWKGGFSEDSLDE
jgi:hypothetical protein